MIDSRLVKHINEMDSWEKDRFRLFVSSPYFNRHKPTIQLLDLILKGVKKEGGRDLERERIYRRIFGKQEEYREQPLFDLMSSLMKLLHQFLAQEKLERLPFTSETLTLRMAEEHKRFDLMRNRAKRLGRQLEEYTFRDADYQFADYVRQQGLGYYEGQYGDRSKSKNLQLMLERLDNFYLVEKLKHCAHLTANMLLANTKYDFSFLDDVLAYVSGELEGKLAGEHSILAYYYILQSMRTPDEPLYYEHMTYYLSEGFHLISPRERKDVYLFAGNYCIQNIHAQKTEYLRELWELYRRGETTELIYDQGQISEWDYKNAVTMGCTSKEYDWVLRFLEENRERLPEKKQLNAYSLSRAIYHYSRKEYDEAGDHLRNVEDSDVAYHLNRVMLEVRIAYDRREINYLTNTLETFRLFVMRNRKISASDRRSYTNYARFAKQLGILRFNQEFTDRDQYRKKMTDLHAKIAAATEVKAYQWLLEESKVEKEPISR